MCADTTITIAATTATTTASASTATTTMTTSTFATTANTFNLMVILSEQDYDTFYESCYVAVYDIMQRRRR